MYQMFYFSVLLESFDKKSILFFLGKAEVILKEHILDITTFQFVWLYHTDTPRIKSEDCVSFKQCFHLFDGILAYIVSFHCCWKI